MSDLLYKLAFGYFAIGTTWFVIMMIYVSFAGKRILQGFLLLCVFGWALTLGGDIWSRITKRKNYFSLDNLIVEQ